MVFWDNTNYASYELAAQGEDGLAVVSVVYEVRKWVVCGKCFTSDSLIHGIFTF